MQDNLLKLLHLLSPSVRALTSNKAEAGSLEPLIHGVEPLPAAADSPTGAACAVGLGRQHPLLTRVKGMSSIQDDAHATTAEVSQCHVCRLSTALVHLQPAFHQPRDRPTL